MTPYTMADPVRTAAMTTEALRAGFLIEDLFAAGEVRLAYCDADRAVIGGAVPGGGQLVLTGNESLRSAYFTERREVGVFNVGRAGTVTVDGRSHALGPLDGLYVGRGSRDVRFASDDPASPAAFYLLSYPAHAPFPTTLIKQSQVEGLRLGTEAACNRRTLYKYVHPAGVGSCQLVMGFTQMEAGSVWNTMPPHTHARRSEVYLYFNVPADARVFHLMGEPNQTRHLVVADRQAVISPSWSVHSGVGTAAYAFCWGMGGENQAFDDMDPVPIATLR